MPNRGLPKTSGIQPRPLLSAEATASGSGSRKAACAMSPNISKVVIDPTTVVLAGDSAGAQLSSQLATLVTDPAYANRVGVVPSLRPDRSVRTKKKGMPRWP